MKKNTPTHPAACDWQAVLKTLHGRRVLFEIMQVAQLDQHGFIPNDALSTAFHCGQRSIGLYVKNNIQASDPAVLFQMQTEYQAAVEEKQAEINRQQEENNG